MILATTECHVTMKIVIHRHHPLHTDHPARSYRLNKYRIDPQDSDAWTGKGLVLDELNKSDEAIKTFDKVIELNSQNSIALKFKKLI